MVPSGGWVWSIVLSLLWMRWISWCVCAFLWCWYTKCGLCCTSQRHWWSPPWTTISSKPAWVGRGKWMGGMAYGSIMVPWLLAYVVARWSSSSSYLSHYTHHHHICIHYQRSLRIHHGAVVARIRLKIGQGKRKVKIGAGGGNSLRIHHGAMVARIRRCQVMVMVIKMMMMWLIVGMRGLLTGPSWCRGCLHRSLPGGGKSCGQAFCGYQTAHHHPCSVKCLLGLQIVYSYWIKVNWSCIG